MIEMGNSAAGQFCWVDLAASDAERAKSFYGRLFGWKSRARADSGSFTRLHLDGREVASVYQLGEARLRHGVPSHWMPYVQVDDVEDAARRAALLGGRVTVRPFTISGVARTALIVDSIGAHIGLWEPIDSGAQEHAHA